MSCFSELYYGIAKIANDLKQPLLKNRREIISSRDWLACYLSHKVMRCLSSVRRASEDVNLLFAFREMVDS